MFRNLLLPKIWPPLTGLLAGILLNFAFSLKNVYFLFFGLIGLSLLKSSSSSRLAFYSGFLAGIVIYAYQLKFFFTLFSFGAFALWAVLAFWIGLFCVFARAAQIRF